MKKKKKRLISEWCLFCYKYLTAVLDYCSLLAWHGTPFSTEGKPWELWAMWPDYRNECHLNAHLYSLMCCAGQCVHVCVYTKCSCSVVAVLFMSHQWSECFMSARVTVLEHYILVTTYTSGLLSVGRRMRRNILSVCLCCCWEWCTCYQYCPQRMNGWMNAFLLLSHLHLIPFYFNWQSWHNYTTIVCVTVCLCGGIQWFTLG